jgi:hypothetical protein
MYCGPGYVFGGTGLVFDCAKCVGSRFRVLRVGTSFRRYRGHRVPFSSFALPDSISVVPRALAPDFMFCAAGLIFGGTEGLRFHFHVLRARTRFPRFRWRQIPFLSFALPDTFSVVRGASVPVFMFCAPLVVSRSTAGVMSRFHILRSRTPFWRYRGHWVPSSSFASPDSFSAVRRASDPIFMFCAPGHVFCDTEGV